jgi:hypothetical protein
VPKAFLKVLGRFSNLLTFPAVGQTEDRGRWRDSKTALQEEKSASLSRFDFGLAFPLRYIFGAF